MLPGAASFRIIAPYYEADGSQAEWVRPEKYRSYRYSVSPNLTRCPLRPTATLHLPAHPSAHGTYCNTFLRNLTQMNGQVHGLPAVVECSADVFTKKHLRVDHLISLVWLEEMYHDLI